MIQPQLILLREGTDASQGKPQLISNINACMNVVDTVKTTLGPCGMDKLIHNGREVNISNDGATIMNLLEVVHPAAKCLVDIAISQDHEVGDGTTSVVVLAGELLKEAKNCVEDGIAPQVIIKAFRNALSVVMEALQKLCVPFDPNAEEGRRNLVRCAETALNSKLINTERYFFAKMATDAVLSLDNDLNLDMIGIKKVPGGSMGESILVDGVAFKKTFSYAGFEQQPKKFQCPKVLLLHVELELKAEKDNAEVRVKDPKQYQSIVDAEWKIIFDKMEKCVRSGAKIVLSRLPIGDIATQYFADRDIFCAGRVAADDMARVALATGGVVQSTVSNITEDVLGSCALFEERQVGPERYNFFTGCRNSKTVTIILRGGAQQFIDEADRSLHDAICIVKRAYRTGSVVGGGGAVEMELSKVLREYSRTIRGKGQMVISGFARALEVIPRQLAENAGHDSTDSLNKLRQKHHASDQSGKWYGVDILHGGVCDTFERFVWEPTLVKRNAIQSATEAACLVLSVDETVTNPESEAGKKQAAAGRGGGAMPVSKAGMGGLFKGAPGVTRMKGRAGR
ncbi:T-complex protein 1, eta subunit, putative [Trypanosoma equiperdum]|uniref:T-complex protein 1 subunit eta n=3 Tax=Trypanozoon TaxID=39700 RepID=Q38DP9_TRYB2|nr:t-complex protein 1 subunit eta [Trypanosoma brucei brucei TREU927]EAN77071.1 t-complex protein 1, eta subunit, putative [Trypanosoma brucei brucei TREU927]RHW70257.1 T-complex protein 1 [Trypanosoma brucei equiperdum]SCU68927.1 T-complex protein 1, eta subunit, putative [Trypanosoma equiperdum]